MHHLRSILTPLHVFLITGFSSDCPPIAKKLAALVADVTESTFPLDETRSSVRELEKRRLCRVAPDSKATSPTES